VQTKHAAREVFLTHIEDARLEGEAILRHCTVLSSHKFAKATAVGNDVFLCQYSYDERYQARPLNVMTRVTISGASCVPSRRSLQHTTWCPLN